MVRIYKWQPIVGSAEGDIWGQLPPSGVLKIFEQSAVAAAAEVGYGKEFHIRNASAWIIRRMTLLMGTPARLGDRLELSTWLSNVARVRGNREYILDNLTSGGAAATGIAEWVYIDRNKVVPKVIPKEIEVDFDIPGAPLHTYEPPAVEPLEEKAEFATERVAEWYECDSMGHVNNTVYADWLDSGFRAAMESAGWDVGVLKSEGLQLRGEYFAMDYKRPAMPRDHLTTTTRIEGLSSRLCQVYQEIANNEGTVLLTARSVYGWADRLGTPTDAPAGWVERGFLSASLAS
ncbi:MAG: thioesterase family protein [Chloroflexota bacterium]